jgi:hypothetical protein
MSASRVRRPAGSICCNCVGRMAFVVHAAGAERVRRLERCCCAVVTSNLGDGGDDFSGHPHFSAVVVSSHMVGGQSEERCQRVGAATSAGSEEL